MRRYVNKNPCKPRSVPGLVVLFFAYCTVLGAKAEVSKEPITGAGTFLRYCAGCHGFDGFAAYEHAPSFSMGERLQKDDRELLQSVLNGKNNMPPWKDKLPVQNLRDAITYLRLMNERYKKGEPPRQDEIPDLYYLFKPVGEESLKWKTGEDFR